MMDNSRLLYLLDCFFANSVTPAQKDELMLLLDSNKYDKEVKSYIDNNWHKSNSSDQLTDQQSDAILSAILTNKTASVFSLPATNNFKKWILAAAAVLLIGVSTAAWFLFSGSLQKQHIMASQNQTGKPHKNDVAPGYNGAVLTLSDGSVIVLDSASEGNLAMQGNSKIMKKGGGVQYVSKTTGNEMASGYNTIGTPRGRQFQLVLEDGTKVWLNAESSIHFPIVFGKKERLVEITGEVYFEVAKNPDRPFTVSVKGMQVQVLGTHFNINSYNDEESIKTTLLEGAVKVFKDGDIKLLSPGQQANLYNTGEMSLLKSVNTGEIIAWKNDQFSFDNTDVKNLARQLTRWYDVEMEMPQNINPVTFTGTISKKSNLSDVLTMLELTGEVAFSIEGKKVKITM